MRQLILLRHAKAERGAPGGSDHDRQLAERGRDDARLIGAWLTAHHVRLDRVVVSTSRRTRETWDFVRGELSKLPPVVDEARLYESSPGTIIDLARDTPPDVRTVMMIGHNPGMQEAATLLIASGDVEAREALNEGFPTSGLVIIDFMVDDWNDIHESGGRLERFISPKLLEGATD